MIKKNHQRFLEHLEKSRQFVDLVDKWLNEAGIKSRVLPMKKAPSHAQWKRYADHGDLITENGRVEVKHLDCLFSNAETWPFKDFIVCAVHAWDRAEPKPFEFIYLNKSLTFGARLKGSTRNEWTVGVRKDQRYESVSQKFYFAPIPLVEFFPFLKIESDNYQATYENYDMDRLERAWAAIGVKINRVRVKDHIELLSGIHRENLNGIR
jgi:hypothetical protein